MQDLLNAARLVLVLADLNKNQPPPTFPRLGVADNRRETPILEGQALANKKRLTGTQDHRYAGLTLARDPEGGAAVPATSYVDAQSCYPGATKQHEDFHHMLRRIENIHGQPSRAKVVAHLINAIPPASRSVVEDQVSRSYPGLDPSNPDHHEEVLAELCGYMNGGKIKPGLRLTGGRLLHARLV